MSSFNPLSFTFVYRCGTYVLHTYDCPFSQSFCSCCLLTTWKCVPLVELPEGRNALPPTHNTLHLGCSYHLHSTHRFLSTWGVVTLEKNGKKVLKVDIGNACFQGCHIYLYAPMIIHLALALHTTDHQQPPMPNLKSGNLSCGKLLYLFSNTHN